MKKMKGSAWPITCLGCGHIFIYKPYWLSGRKPFCMSCVAHQNKIIERDKELWKEGQDKRRSE